MEKVDDTHIHVAYCQLNSLCCIYTSQHSYPCDRYLICSCIAILGSFEKYTRNIEIYHMRWYQLPIEYQTYLVLMIGYGQQPLQYNGYRLVIINRGTSLKVMTKMLIMTCWYAIHFPFGDSDRLFVRWRRIKWSWELLYLYEEWNHTIVWF